MLITCFALFSGELWAEEQTGRVVGCVQSEGMDPYRGVASLWAVSEGRVPDPRRYIVIPTTAANIQPDGCFTLQAPAGEYYVGAVLRTTPGVTMGPPRVGDLVFMTPDKGGDVLQVQVNAGASIDVGSKKNGWVYEGFTAELEMGVRGKVVDVEGRPVAGLLVFAFADQEVSGSPLAVSDRTSASGHYQLRLDRPGEVYLRVKDAYGGGAPKPRGYVGVYGQGKPVPLTIEADQVVDPIDIEVMQVPEEMKKLKKNNQPSPETP